MNTTRATGQTSIVVNGHNMLQLDTLPLLTVVAVGGDRSPHLTIIGGPLDGQITMRTPSGAMTLAVDQLVRVVKAPPTWMP